MNFFKEFMKHILVLGEHNVRQHNGREQSVYQEVHRRS